VQLLYPRRSRPQETEFADLRPGESASETFNRFGENAQRILNRPLQGGVGVMIMSSGHASFVLGSPMAGIAIA